MNLNTNPEQRESSGISAPGSVGRAIRKHPLYVVIFHDSKAGHTAFLETIIDHQHVSWKSKRFTSSDKCKAETWHWFYDNLPAFRPIFIDQTGV